MTHKEQKAKAYIDAEKNPEIKAKMQRYFDNREQDSGFFGRITELASRTEKSRKNAVAVAGKADTRIRFENENGKVVSISAEVKTNGGRIANLLKKNAPKFVIYTLDFSNSIASRHLPPLVFRTSRFLELLDECGAIKQTNGTNNEPAIQTTSKKLFEALCDYPIVYDPNAVYTADDFEGL